MKETYTPMTWSERRKMQGLDIEAEASVEEEKSLPTTNLEVSAKMMKGLTIGQKITVTVVGTITGLRTKDYDQGIKLDIESISIPKSELAAEVQKLS